MATMTGAGRPAGMLTKYRRWHWLLQKARDLRGIDVLNAALVDAYLDEFKPAFRATYWGAHKCRQLGQDLAAMAELGYLHRHRVGLSGGAWQPGFPTWVWSYRPGRHAGHLDTIAAALPPTT